jgi:nitroreductase
VRSYAGRDLEPAARQGLEEACRSLHAGPLGSSCRFMVIEAREQPDAPSPPLRLGTYGQIRGAPAFLVGAVRQGVHDLEDYGYLFELLVLKALELGLGTCWLGGIFTRRSFARGLHLQEGELLPAVSPVGVPAQGYRLLDGVIRLGAGSARRLPWSKLFFDAQWGHPLGEQRADGLPLALEMLRLAPSASNRQPWRLLQERPGGPCHLFLRRTPGYRRVTPLDLQRVDMGIAMAHFDLGAAEAGIPGSWSVAATPPPGAAPGGYVATWRSDVSRDRSGGACD